MGIYAQKKSNDTLSDNSSTESTAKKDIWKWYYHNEQLGEQGQYKNKKKEGEWKWYFKNGALKTIGSYKNGQPTGLRKWYYSHEKLYCTGQYADGKRDGEWTWYNYNEQPRIVVSFDKGVVLKYNGFDNWGNVIFNIKGSKTTQVIFQENHSYLGVFGIRLKEKNGYSLLLDNAELYIDNYKNGKLHGESTAYYTNGTIFKIENYKKGKLHGKSQQFTEKGMPRYSSNYKKGVRNGVYKEYYENGPLKSTGNIKNNKDVGTWKKYSEDGQIRETIKYHRNKVSTHDKNGQLTSQIVYANDKKEKVLTTFYENGNLESISPFKDDKLHGDALQYYKNGKLKENTPYTNGKIDGLWTKYDDLGMPKEKTQIKDGNFKELHQTYFYPNGQIKATGHSNNGIEKYGVWRMYYEGGQLMEENVYDDDNQKAIEKEYDKEGWLRSMRNEKYGISNLYYKNGQLRIKGHYANIKKHADGSKYVMGKWEYYSNGKLKYVNLFRRDTLVKWKSYYKNGQLRRSTDYYNRKPKGTSELYHKNAQLYKVQVWDYKNKIADHGKKLVAIKACFDGKGNILDKGTLENGTGTVKEYNSEGNLINNIIYVDGKPINTNKSIDAIWLNSRELNTRAWKIYKEESNKEKLNFAILWVEQSISLDENYHNTDTYAALLYKSGRYKQALVIAKKAIKIAKSTNTAFKSTAALIEKINGKLKN